MAITNVLRFPADFDRAVKPLPVVKADNGVNLRALFKFTDDKGVAREAADEWQLRGPLTYIPRADVVSVYVRRGMCVGSVCVCGVLNYVWAVASIDVACLILP